MEDDPVDEMSTKYEEAPLRYKQAAPADDYIALVIALALALAVVVIICVAVWPVL